jgi:hypothetical protein
MKPANVLFTLMLATLFTHELDAVTHSEWRLLYILRSLPDEQARTWFVAIHVPLFGALMAVSYHAKAALQRGCRIGMALFCIVHALLHIRLRDDPFYTFHSPLSWGLILCAAALGLLYQLMTWRSHEPR